MQIAISGCGAVSPAGWGTAVLAKSLREKASVPVKELVPPGGRAPLRVRVVPPPEKKPGAFLHARLRRTSPISQYAVAAAMEALGNDTAPGGDERLGIVCSVMCGCVNYSGRFYGEVLKNPATASPLLFPETVFNAPASHLATLLGAKGMAYTVIGDQGSFLGGLAIAANWLANNMADRCLVVAAEEIDVLTADAARLFDRNVIMAEGAGALLLCRSDGPGPVHLDCITDPRLITRKRSRERAAWELRQEMGSPPHAVLYDSQSTCGRFDRAEAAAWADWNCPRVSVKKVLGEGFCASPAWQCVSAVQSLITSPGLTAAVINVMGSNEQAIAARFIRERG